MKILEIDKHHGYVKVRVEYDDDLWILCMVIASGDIVSALTIRDVRLGQEKHRIPMRLAIKVEKLEFQPFTGRLRIHGVIIKGPDEYGLTVSHHTLSIDIGSEVKMVKKE